MTMRKQPLGLHRQREGDAKTGEGGKPLPPDSFGIYARDATGRVKIGTTHRVGRAAWQARTLAEHGSRESAVFPRHTEAMSWLGEQWQARGEGGAADGGGSAPAREGGQSHEAEQVREVPGQEQGDSQGEQQGEQQGELAAERTAEVSADVVPAPQFSDDPFGDPFAP